MSSVSSPDVFQGWHHYLIGKDFLLSNFNHSKLQRRRERYIIIHTWKIIMDIVPNDLRHWYEVCRQQKAWYPSCCPCFQQNLYHEGKNILRQLFRSQCCPTLEPPPSRSKDIPLVRQIQNITVLSDIPDLPPVTGYSTGKRNSLLDRSNQS